jgi:long-chain acyl-CoA synthetase
MLLPELLDERVRATPDAISFIQSGGTGRADDVVSWQELKRRAEALALGLVELGVQPGDRVAVMGQTTGEWAIADFAILFAGAVSVGIYPTLTSAQIGYILRDCEAKVAFVGSKKELVELREAAENAPALEAIIGWGDAEDTTHRFESLLDRGRAALANDRSVLDERRRARTPDDLALLIYTSGTTGVPKGAMLSHRNCLFQARALSPVFPASTEDITVAFLPMAHVGEHVMAFYGRVCTGMAARYVGSIDSQAVLAAVQTTAPTVFGSVPRIFEKAYAKIRATVASSSPQRQRLFAWAEKRGREVSAHRAAGTVPSLRTRLEHAVADRLVFKKIRDRFGGRVRYFVSGSAPIDKEILEFFDACGMLVLEGYGLTETSGFCTANRRDAYRFGTVGRPIGGFEVRCAEDGEILVRSEASFLGYLNQPEATRIALEDGWVHTGDIGVIDAEGYLRITDRKKNLIVTSGGKKVAPAPIEALFTDEPILGPTLVIGESRPYLTAILTLDLVEARAATGLTDATPAVLASHATVATRVHAAVDRANAQLARFERIRRFRILDRELAIGEDLTPTMKLRRKAVEQRFAPEIDALYAEAAIAPVREAKELASNLSPRSS